MTSDPSWINQFAFQIASLNPGMIDRVADSLERIRLKVVSDMHARINLSRTIQELSAFTRGHLLYLLLERVLHCRGGMEVEKVSTRLLVKLAQSRMVVEFCVKEDEDVEALASYFIAQVSVSSKLGRLADVSAPLMWINGLEGLANFARASSSFREHLMCRDPGAELMLILQQSFSKNYVQNQNPETVQKSREYAARLLVALALNEDSRSWVLDHGFFDLTAAILASQNPAIVPRAARDGAVVILNLVLFRLMESPETLLAMRRLGAAAILRPHAAALNAVNPELFEHLEAAVARGAAAPRDARGSAREWATLRTAATGEDLVPIVCSWEGCLEGPEKPSEEKFHRCSSCQLAYYCSKEHQRQHWRTHKRQCKSDSAD